MQHPNIKICHMLCANSTFHITDDLSFVPFYNFKYIRVYIVDLFCNINNMRLSYLLSDMRFPETQWRSYFNFSSLIWISNFPNLCIKVPKLGFLKFFGIFKYTSKMDTYSSHLKQMYMFIQDVQGLYWNICLNCLISNNFYHKSVWIIWIWISQTYEIKL